MIKEKLCQLVSGVFIFLLIFSASFSPRSVMAAESVNDQLEMLSDQLIALGKVIMNSENISDENRLILMSQLVAISVEILNLKKGVTNPVSNLPGKVNAKDIDLNQIILSYDVETNLASAELNYKNKTVNQTYKLAIIENAVDYNEKLRILKEEVSKDISSSTNVIEKEIQDLIFLSSRNPVRNKSIAQNSGTANQLLEEFAQNSIVNKVVISPKMKIGSIEFFTDQDESLKLSLGKEYSIDYNSNKSELDTYTYSYELFVSATPDSFTDLDQEGQFYLKPKILTTVTELTKDNIEKEITGLFSNIPFTTQIPNFGSKLIKFLTDNTVHYITGANSGQVKDSERDCYSGSDKVVVNDFVRYLADGLNAQYEDINSMTTYLAPIVLDNDYSEPPACRNKMRVF